MLVEITASRRFSLCGEYVFVCVFFVIVNHRINVHRSSGPRLSASLVPQRRASTPRSTRYLLCLSVCLSAKASFTLRTELNQILEPTSMYGVTKVHTLSLFQHHSRFFISLPTDTIHLRYVYSIFKVVGHWRASVSVLLEEIRPRRSFSAVSLIYLSSSDSEAVLHVTT
jgi:hypothetical protein